MERKVTPLSRPLRISTVKVWETPRKKKDSDSTVNISGAIFFVSQKILWAKSQAWIQEYQVSIVFSYKNFFSCSSTLKFQRNPGFITCGSNSLWEIEGYMGFWRLFLQPETHLLFIIVFLQAYQKKHSKILMLVLSENKYRRGRKNGE